MSNVITALFETPTKAAIAIHQLEIMGVTQDEISVIAGDKVSGNSFALDEGTKLPEGLAIGSVSGGLLAGIISGLTAVGAVATGGLGLLASGPLVAALAGAGAGAMAGGVIGGAIGAAIPEHEVKYYEAALEKGSVLIGVKYNDDNEKQIKKLLEAAGAEKVATA